MWSFATARIAAPAAPGNNATAVLFDSTKVFGAKMMRSFGIGRVGLSFPVLDQASATNGLVGWQSADGGTTWKKFSFGYTGSATGTLPATVTAETATGSLTFDIYVGTCDDVKFEFTAGATGPTSGTGWAPVITFRQGDVHAGA